MNNKIKKIHLSIDNETKCYVSYADYKKMKQSYEKKIKSLKKDSRKQYKKYDEIELAGDKYFVLNVRNDEIDVCMKDVLTREEMLKYFTDKWYQDSSDYCVRYNSDIRNNRYQDSYIFKILNSTFKEDKYKDLNIIGDVRLLTKEEVESLDEEHRNISKYYWTMTPYNNMNELEYGTHAVVFYVNSSGGLSLWGVDFSCGLRPVITLKTDELLGL